jgi:hypothetical protein
MRVWNARLIGMPSDHTTSTIMRTRSMRKQSKNFLRFLVHR